MPPLREPTRLAALLALFALGGCGPDPPERNLLLVTVDTLRADRLGAYGHPGGLTPTLDGLAAESLVYERVWAPASFTLPSVGALMTGFHPEELGVLTNLAALPEMAPTLAETLAAEGYSTGAVVSSSVLTREAGLHRGFQRYDNRLDEREKNRPEVPERTAPGTTRAALLMLERLVEDGEPFFLWVHYQDPHGPYTPPEDLLRQGLGDHLSSGDGARELELGGDHRGLGSIPRYQVLGEERRVGWYRASYEAEVAYLDRELAPFLEHFRPGARCADTLVAFTSDHGEGLGENDYWFAHGEYLTEALLRVPLLVRDPGTPAGRVSEPLSLVDLAPMLLARLGLERRLGREREGATPLGGGRVYASTLGGSGQPHRFLLEDGRRLLAYEDGRLQLYPEPGEETPLDDPEGVRRLQSSLEEVRAALLQPPQEETREPSEAALEMLEKMGYLESTDEED